VTANPTANPAVTPAKAPYKGSAGAQEIQKLNPAIKDVNKIQPGQALKMPDGSTYTVKPGDTLDRIAKGVKPAVTQQDRIDKAPPAATPPTVRGPTQPAATPPAAPAAPFRKELDIDRIKQLSGAPAKPGKVDLSVTNPAMNPVNNTTPAPAAKPTTTSTNTSVSGTMKMGKPDGPIQYNGKTVNPGQPEYAAASQALMTQQGRIQQVRQGMQPGGGGAPKLSTAPVAQGATNADRADFESVRNIDDAILERIRSALKF
jgi:hypothetical protein